MTSPQKPLHFAETIFANTDFINARSMDTILNRTNIFIRSQMVTSDYLAGGGDGDSALLKKESITKGEDAQSMLESYFKLMSPVSPKNEGRTTDLAHSKAYKNCQASGSTMITTNVFLLLAVTSIAAYLS